PSTQEHATSVTSYPVHPSLPSFSHYTLFCYPPFLFFFTATTTTDIYTLSLHDALPILTTTAAPREARTFTTISARPIERLYTPEDRKSTRLNSSHQIISYAVFCLKKKKKNTKTKETTQQACKLQ